MVVNCIIVCTFDFFPFVWFALPPINTLSVFVFSKLTAMWERVVVSDECPVKSSASISDLFEVSS